MCKANDKLTLFSYSLGKLVELHKDFYRQSTQMNTVMSSDEALLSFSNTRIMKLLYCLCLESLGNDDENLRKDNLFGFFGAFSALPNGPVLLHVYEALDIVPGFVYKDGRFCQFRGPSDDVRSLVPKEFDEKYPGVVQMVDKAAEGLREHMAPGLFMDRSKLVELTHQLPLWQETFLYKIKKEMSTTPQDLKREYEAYTNLRA